jgi:hypothetical protein
MRDTAYLWRYVRLWKAPNAISCTCRPTCIVRKFNPGTIVFMFRHRKKHDVVVYVYSVLGPDLFSL